VLTGVVLLAISAAAFVSYSITREGFFTTIGSRGDKPLAYTWLAIGVLAVIGGLFLVVGGPYASRVYVGIGLGSPTDIRRRPDGTMPPGTGDTKVLTTLLQLSALWHLSFGSFVFGGAVDDRGPQVGAAMVSLILYGALPAILVPFCARRKKWATWSVFVLAILTATIAAGVLLVAFSVRPSSVRTFPGTYTVRNGPMLFLLGFYSLMTGLAAIMAGRSLFLQARDKRAGMRGGETASGVSVGVAQVVSAEMVENATPLRATGDPPVGRGR